MFWMFLLISGVTMMLFQLGAMSVWTKVLGMALAAVVLLAIVVGVVLIGRYLLRRFA
ncbi:MAG: hypothetical protein ACO3YN_14420 [Rubrivivax sp.]